MALSVLSRAFRLLASLKVAIPLLVLLTVVTVVGSLFPQPDLFRSPWYLGLLGLQGLSLLLVTILHVPAILRRKGRNALLGVITTHLGILVLIAGVIYGGTTGFRQEVRVIEGQATVVPGLPFVIRLEQLQVEEYRQEEFPGMNLARLPKRRQDSELTLLKNGLPVYSAVAAPGRPARFDGMTLLPSVSELGWYFELLVIDPLGREKTIPVRPWAPPIVTVGDQRIMTHSVQDGRAEIFAMDENAISSLGFSTAEQALSVGGYQVFLGPVRRYTSLRVYNRPQQPVLVLGAGLMFAGLVWHFYFRHRERRQGAETGDA